MFDALLNQMLVNGLPLEGNPELDGVIHRYCRDSSKKTDEWYIGSWINEKHFTLTYGSWTTGEKHTYVSFKKGEVSPEEIEKYHRIQEENKRQLEKKIEEKKVVAKERFDRISTSKRHKYLINKQIDLEVKCFDSKLLTIPIYHIECSNNYFALESHFMSIQTIDSEGNKRFASGLPAAEGCYYFGEPRKGERIYLCEGFATGYSIWKSINKTVCVCFSANNIYNIVRWLVKNGFKNLTHCQDLGDAGDRIAKEILSFNVYSIKPKFIKSEGNDFNDLFVQEGIEAVRDCFFFAPSSFSVKDLRSMEIPEEKFILDGLIKEGSLNMIWSGPGVGKSFFAYSMSACVAAGMPFLCWNCAKPRNVLYLDAEQSSADIGRYILPAMEKTLSGQENALEWESKMIMMTYDQVYNKIEDELDLLDIRHREYVDREIQQKKIELVVVDNLTSLTSIEALKDWDEKASKWEELRGWMNSHRREGVSIMILHHANKAGGMAGLESMKRPLALELRLEKFNADNPGIDFKLTYVKARLNPELRKPLRVKYSRDVGWEGNSLVIQ